MDLWAWTTVVFRGSRSWAPKCSVREQEKGFIDQIALGAIGEMVAAAGDGADLVSIPMVEARRQKKRPPGFRRRPGALQHGVEMRVIAGEVEDRAAEDHVGEGVGEGVGFDGFGAEMAWRQGRNGSDPDRLRRPRSLLRRK